MGIGTSTTFAEAVRFATEIQLGFPDTPGLAPVGAEAATSSLFVGQHFAATALALALSGRFDEALDVARAARGRGGRRLWLVDLRRSSPQPRVIRWRRRTPTACR